MEVSADFKEINKFTGDLQRLFGETDPVVLERATKLAKSEVIRKHFNDFSLVQKCVAHFALNLNEMDPNDPYLIASRILLGCPALDISLMSDSEFKTFISVLPDNIADLLFIKRTPTDDFIKDMVHTCLLGIKLDKPAKFLAWSYGKVTIRAWSRLLDLVIPRDPEEFQVFLSIILPPLARNLKELAEAAKLAKLYGYADASQFLTKVFDAVHFVTYLACPRKNRRRLPYDDIAKLVKAPERSSPKSK